VKYSKIIGTVDVVLLVSTQMFHPIPNLR